MKTAFPALLRLCLLLPSFFSATACSGARESSSVAVTRSDSSGVEIVQHPPVEAYGGPVYEVEYLLKVSDTLSSGEGEFGWVADADMLPDGSLVVLDRFSAEVRIFSARGEFVRRIGRRGPGPGELSGGGTLCILLLPSDLLALPDISNQAVVVFETAGSHQANLRFDIMEEYIPQWRVLSGDTLMVLVSTEETSSFVMRTLDGDWRDTVAVKDTPFLGPSPIDGRWPLMKDHPLWSASSPERLVVSQMTQPGLSLFEGTTLRRLIRWSHEEEDLSEADVDVLLGIAARVIGDPSGNPESARSQMAPPERPPVMADVEVGPELIMVQRLRPIEEMDRRILSTIGAAGYGGPVWDVFSWSGEYLGILDFGENVEVFRVRGDTVIGVQEDSMGVARPFLARLPPELSTRSAKR